MNNQLTTQDLTGVKLVSDDNFAPLFEVRAAIDYAITQGSQGWGVTREAGVYNFLARELLTALEVATTADENHRMLKGAQLKLGKLEKKIEKLKAENLALDLHIKELNIDLDDRDKRVAEMKKELDEASEA